MTLPEQFIDNIRAIFPPQLYEQFLKGLDEKPTVSIRLNPFKHTSEEGVTASSYETVPWCEEGRYLSERPSFTADPLFHAGDYYVQEASSMFIHHVVKQLPIKPLLALDLCAAPGGKTTCLRSVLPESCLLMCNEPHPQRVQILKENVIKFGHPKVVVTHNYPRDYSRTHLQFDLILTDMPCSGEGMFRKDPNSINEWSMGNVRKCQELQRSIAKDIWDNLRPGGFLIYSTCTFNTYENEENVEWIAQTLGAEHYEIPVSEEWHITPALQSNIPAYRFIPGVSRGEGLFLSVLRKKGTFAEATPISPKSLEKELSRLKVLSYGVRPPVPKGKKLIPDVSQALSINDASDAYPLIAVDYPTAIAYLRHEAITLPPDSAKGIVTIAYQGRALGYANNLGSRANNLYPQAWRIHKNL